NACSGGLSHGRRGERASGDPRQRGRTIMRRTLAVLLAIVALVSLGEAKATHITYTETATLSGSLGTTNFTSALVTITGVADTNDVVQNFDIFNVIVGAPQVTIANVGTALFTDVIQAVVNQSRGVAGFGDNTNNHFLLGNANDAFNTYDL